MGWFSNAVKNLRPDKILKDPKKATRMALDPAGEVVRAGRSNYNSMPNNMRSAFDPGGFFDGRDPVKYPSYTPGGQLRLSAGAQELYDRMKARTAEREAARMAQQQPTLNVTGKGVKGALQAIRQYQQQQPLPTVSGRGIKGGMQLASQLHQQQQPQPQLASQLHQQQQPQPQPQPQPEPLQTPARRGGVRIPPKNFYADGGQVCDAHSKSTSKVVNRKPNGKPY